MKRRASRKYRRDCGYAFMAVKPRDWKPSKVVVDVEYRCPRGAPGYVAFDVQNAIAALKSGIDALADVGVIETDHHENVRWGRFELITQQRQMRGLIPGVTLIVRAQ